MASSASPILPASTPILTPSTAATTTFQPPTQPPALRPFINSLTSRIRDGVSRSRPWSELTDRSAFSQPDSLSDAASRIRRNYSYFRLNYLLLVSLVVGFSLISHPGSLILLLALLAAWTFLYLLRPTDQPLVLFGRTYSDLQTLGILVVATVFVVFLTSVGSVLISAILVGVAAVCAHGSFRVPDDLFLEETPSDQVSAGFLSFLGGAAKNAAAAAPSVVAAARV